MSIILERESATWLEGVVDCHVYPGPDVYALRQFNIIELAKQARAVGYAGFIAKTHTYNNAALCALASTLVPGIRVCGSIVLNWTVGGLNPEAVEACLLMGGKEIWLGNMHVGQLKMRGMLPKTPYGRVAMPPSYRDTAFSRALPAINTLDDEGQIVPELLTILDLIADYDAILGTCHISKAECFAIVPEAKQRGVKRIVITHPKIFSDLPETPSMEAWNPDILEYWHPDELKRIAALGAKLELVTPTTQTAKYVADTIRSVGADCCVAGSSKGFLYGMHPIEAIRVFMVLMVNEGIPLKDVRTIFVDNGQWLIDY